jgi:hypothetical protein
MKVMIDNELILELSDVKKQVLKSEIHDHIFDEDMKRRIQWIIIHKYEECFRKLKDKWDPILVVNGVKMVPTDQDEYASLVFAQPNYQSRSERESIK